MAAIITLKVDIDPVTGIPSKNLTNDVKTRLKNELNVDAKTTEEAMTNEKVLKYIQECIDKTNSKAVSRAAHVRKWKLIPTDFSLPGGELTPTLKLKRKVTENKYKALIEEMYQDAKI